jgi:hypothetical protein
VGQHDSLGVARRSRCVANGAQVLWSRWLSFHSKNNKKQIVKARSFLLNLDLTFANVNTTYHWPVFLFGSQLFDIVEAQGVDAFTLGQLDRLLRDGFDVDQLLQTRG